MKENILFILIFIIGNSLNSQKSLSQLKTDFDNEWDRSLSYYTSQTTGSEPPGSQRRYYDFRVIDGLIYMIQATGDLKYVDDLVWYVDRVMGLAVVTTGGYYDWPVDGTNYQLYDGHGLRNIFKFLYLAEKYPAIKTRMTSTKFNSWKSWFTTNLWDKWKSRGNGSIMRSTTHMSSHMSSNMALYLYLMEPPGSTKNEYLSWVNAWNDNVDSKYNHGGPPNTGFRDQLRIERDGYVWAGSWGNLTGSNDITHTNAEIQAVINQHTHAIGSWSNGDIGLFKNTLENLLDDCSDQVSFSDIPSYINGSAGSISVRIISYGWAMLARFDNILQVRIENYQPSQLESSRYLNNFLGVLAFNRAYIDETVIYPENTSDLPIINLNGSNPMTLQVGQPYNEPGATATNTTNPVVITGTVNTSVAGTYYRYYNVSNEVGPANEVIRTVIVQDTPAPPTSSGRGINYNLWLSIE